MSGQRLADSSQSLLNHLTMDRGQIDPVVPGFRLTPFSRASFVYKHHYLNKQIQLDMFCDGVAIEMFRVTADRSEETLQRSK